MKKLRKVMAFLLMTAMLFSSIQVRAADTSEDSEVPLGRRWITGEDLGTAIVIENPKVRATVGSNVTITPQKYYSYGSWGTNQFSIASETGTHLGFCAEPNSATPSGVFQVSKLNNNVIEGLVLTYIIPELWNLIGVNFYTPGYEYVFCHAAIGYVYSGSLKGLSTSAANGIKAIVADITNIINGANGYAGSEKTRLLNEYLNQYELHIAYNDKQDIVWAEEIPYGQCGLKKASANPDITNGNTCYSLAGAIYGVYSESGCITKQAELITDASGNSNVVTLKKGVYYVKELTAPKGYALDPNVYPVSVSTGATATVSVSDKPQMDPVGVLLGKVDAETNANKPQGSASLQGAEFTMKFYGFVLEDKSVDPATLGYEPLRTWVFQTDEDGYCIYSLACLVSGDELYLSPSGIPSLPIGTLTIEETKAPEGYLINPEVYVRHVTSDGSEENVTTYNQPIIKEKILEMCITKVNDDGESLAGAEFMHTKPDGTTETITTDDEGIAYIKGLEYGTHIIQESKAPEGYRLDRGTFQFTVEEDNTITDIQIIEDEETAWGLFNYEIDEDGNILLEVVNERKLKLPATGSAQTLLLCMAGVLCCFIAVNDKSKRIKRERR